MTNMQLLEAIGMLDDQTLLDAEKPIAKILPAPRRRLVRQISAIAACVCLLFGGAIALQMGGMRAKSEAPAEPNDGSPTYAGAGTESPSDVVGDTTAALAEAVDPSATHTTTTAWTTVAASTTTAASGHHTTAVGDHTGAGEMTETTEAPTGEGVPAWLVYTADLNDIPDTEDYAQVLQAVGLQRLNPENGGFLAIRDGRLYFEQASGESLFAISALDEAYMESAVDTGYTLQYDLEYTAAQADSYASVITEMKTDGQSYRQFVLRAGGGASYGTLYGGMHTPISTLEKNALTAKLSGVSGDVMNTRLTVRIRWYPEAGHTICVKTEDMIDFVEVCSTVGGTHTDRDGYAIGLSIVGAAQGYLDNLRIWLGWADAPSTPDIHYVPYTKAP